MNPSAHSSIHTSTNAYSYTTAGAYCHTAQTYLPCADYASGLYEDPLSSTEGWCSEFVGLGPCSDADKALFEAFLMAEVASTSLSGPCTVFPAYPPPSSSYDPEPSFLHHPIEATQLHTEPLDGFQLYPYAPSSSCSASSPAFEQALPAETKASCIPPDLIYPSPHYDLNLSPEEAFSTVTTSQPSRASRQTHHRGPSSSPYPSPSPSPSPRTSSTIFASQRRNSPARTAAPVASNTWQCPYCPHVQHNRRSPDFKRHIKTHTRDSDVADWVCCGVPVLNAVELGVPPAVVREAQVFEFDGMLMIGGCRKAFSRRDALKRHLQREKGRCFGDALSLHQRGNRDSC